MALVNNQYFEFNEMQPNWSIYRTKMVNWVLDQTLHFLYTFLEYLN